ncbi:MAG: HU family DNA-binding protein [Bacteroidaceae bacterium]|nr:HU family DNA-binding protein [Bacteroidaceae bacterium]
MNNKEFIAELSERTGYSPQRTAQLVAALIDEIGIQLEEENTIVMSGFGSFEVKKKLERVVVNPTTKQRMLVPPKMVVSFKANNILKDKINQK